MEFMLLDKIATFFDIVEKVCYGGFASYLSYIGIKYARDYKESVDEEDFKNSTEHRGR